MIIDNERKTLELRRRGVGSWEAIMPNGDNIVVFYGSVGSEPPQNPKENAAIFKLAWEFIVNDIEGSYLKYRT